LLTERLCKAYPGLQVAYSHSPPFRAQTAAEEQQVCDDIRASQVGLLFVGLGCPKQETWMQRHRGRIPAVMLGVGAAFDFHAGTLARAPLWMREHGLEWLHRLASEPRRLWRRYLWTNSRFVLLAARQLWRH
jgi:N-acetylglucosaminyldiphosphoundecaprenol N-acetyl-beta-D-mannosaminyltransferase